MKATRPLYVRGEIVRDEPDWKIRCECAAMIIAYLEGKPLERQIAATGDFDDLNKLMDAVRQTQMGQKMFGESLENPVEAMVGFAAVHG